jgi:hypothetical protein
MARAARQLDSRSASPIATGARYVSRAARADSKRQLIAELRSSDPALADRLEEVVTLLATIREAEARVLALAANSSKLTADR